jgi:hypothetical protein
VFAAPWFIIEKRRPGLPCPGNMNIIQAGLWQLYRASKDIWKLKQSLLYLISELICLFFTSTGSSDKTQSTSSSATPSTRPSPLFPLSRMKFRPSTVPSLPTSSSSPSLPRPLACMPTGSSSASTRSAQKPCLIQPAFQLCS